MNVIFTVIQMVLALSLITLILLQSSKGGFGAAPAGEQYRTKRGAEKLVFTATIVVSALFLVVSVVSVIFAR